MTTTSSTSGAASTSVATDRGHDVADGGLLVARREADRDRGTGAGFGLEQHGPAPGRTDRSGTDQARRAPGPARRGHASCPGSCPDAADPCYRSRRTRSSRAVEGQARRHRGNQHHDRHRGRAGARCQCLNDEQSESGRLRSRRSRARREQRRRVHRPDGGGPDGTRAWPAMSGVRTRVRDRTRVHLRVVLRPARGGLRLRRDPRRRSAARRSRRGRCRIWRYADLLPVDRNPAVDLGAGFTPLVRADRLAAELGLGELWLKNDTAQPDQLVQGPGHLRRALEGAGVRVQGRGLRVDRQPRELGRGPRGARRVAQLRLHPRQPRAGQDRHDRGLRRQRRGHRRQLRRRQPALRRAGRHVPVGVRERQRAHVLRRGFEDARVRDRRAARVGGARPRGRPGRERLAAHQDPQGLRRAVQGRAPRRGAADARCRARRREGCSPVATRLARRCRHDQAGEARHDRQVAGHRQPGRRLLRARRGAPVRRRPRRGDRRRDRRGHQAARPHRGDLRRDRRRRHDRHAQAARRRRGRAPRRARRRLRHRPRAQDARRGGAHGRARPR